MMNYSWLIDIVDCDKSVVRLRNSTNQLGKAYFFAKLKSAELKGTRLVAHCEEGTWELDILTSVRKKLNSHLSSESKNSSSNSSTHPSIQDTPYFLQKK